MTPSDGKYPEYSPGEKLADGIIQLSGVVAAIVGAVALILWAMMQATGGEVAAVSVYGAALIGTFAASALYHMTPWERMRPTFRRFDHAAIFVKIAGTYTPFVVMLGTVSAYFVLVAIWSVALLGVVRKLFFWRVQGLGGVMLYLAMGWMGVGVIWTLFGLLPVVASAMIVVGGLLYTIGVLHDWGDLLSVGGAEILQRDLAWIRAGRVGLFLCRDHAWCGAGRSIARTHLRERCRSPWSGPERVVHVFANNVARFGMLRLITLVAATLSLAPPAIAHVVGGEIVRQTGAGQFHKFDTDVPFAVGQDTFNTDHLYAFDEDQNILLVEPIRVDIGLGQDFIRAGTTVASHYVFFDGLSGVHIGYVDFDAVILGIAAHQDTMAATDFLANTDVEYISTHMRGLEEGDQVWIDPEDPHRLWVYWAGSSPGDYIRVFTAESGGDLLM